MAYSKQLIDHYENPRNVGSLDKNKKNVEMLNVEQEKVKDLQAELLLSLIHI